VTAAFVFDCKSFFIGSSASWASPRFLFLKALFCVVDCQTSTDQNNNWMNKGQAWESRFENVVVRHRVLTSYGASPILAQSRLLSKEDNAARKGDNRVLAVQGFSSSRLQIASSQLLDARFLFIHSNNAWNGDVCLAGMERKSNAAGTLA